MSELIWYGIDDPCAWMRREAEENEVIIIALSSPEDYKVRFIGHSEKSIFRALHGYIEKLHPKPENREEENYGGWINELYQRGLSPRIAWIGSCLKEDLSRVKAEYIRLYKEQGCELLNKYSQ